MTHASAGGTLSLYSLSLSNKYISKCCTRFIPHDGTTAHMLYGFRTLAETPYVCVQLRYCRLARGIIRAFLLGFYRERATPLLLAAASLDVTQ